MNSRFFDRLSTVWRNAALLFFNTAILLVIVNLLIAVFDRGAVAGPAATGPVTADGGGPRQGPQRTAWQLQNIDLAAYGEPEADVEHMLDDMSALNGRGLIYLPWIEFANPPFQSDTINIDDGDIGCRIRHSIEPPPPPQAKGDVTNVIVFGGSTAFGWNVADKDTLGSCLWRSLTARFPTHRFRVINYGIPEYFSSQEVLLYTRLLKSGHHPHIAIFLDGLNDTLQLSSLRDEGFYTHILFDQFERMQFPIDAAPLQSLQWIPMVRLAYQLRHQPTSTPIVRAEQTVAVSNPEVSAAFVLRTVQDNRRWATVVSDAYGCRPYFFWQPVPFYRYDMSLHRSPVSVSPSLIQVFSIVFDAMQHDKQGIDLANLFETWGHRKAYIDDVHYSPAFMQFLADHMVQSIQLPY